MALPKGGAWPPKNLQPIYEQYAVHDAWYTGDTDRLAAIYEATAVNGSRPVNRPSTYRGGIVGAVARWFWGQPATSGEPRKKLHIPLASDICVASSDLLFSEPPKLTAVATDTQDRLQQLIEDGIQATLLELAEVGAALGGGWLRTLWDDEVSDRPWLGVVHPDAAVPEWRHGRPVGVTFWRTVEAEDNGTCLYHLERHEPGWILNGLFKGSEGSLGRQLELGASAATAGLEPAIETKIPKLSANYIPNMKPNRGWRNYPPGAHLGRSDLYGVEPLMDALDEVWTSWMRDIRIAKGRLVVPQGYLTSEGPGRGASFDLDREVYEEVNSLPGEGLEMTAQQFAIRVKEHSESAAALMSNILRTAGYSEQTFGLTGSVPMTATEVGARERRSILTAGKKSVYFRPELSSAVETLLMVEAALFDSGVVPERPIIEFGDSVAEDPKTTAQTINLLSQAQAVSTEIKVRMLHQDWDDTLILEEVERIRLENGIGEMVADPFNLHPDDEDGPLPGEG